MELRLRLVMMVNLGGVQINNMDAPFVIDTGAVSVVIPE